MRSKKADELVGMAMLFLDIENFSKLSPTQLGSYLRQVLPELARVIKPYSEKLFTLNTWGDAIMAASPANLEIARLALALRDYFNETNFELKNLPTLLLPRIALHSGLVYAARDPFKHGNGVIGTAVNLTARIEPIIAPGEVWTTEQFGSTLTDFLSSEKMALDPLGVRELAKNAGPMSLLRLRRANETPRATDPGVTIAAPVTLREEHNPMEFLLNLQKALHTDLDGITREHYSAFRERLLHDPATRDVVPRIFERSKNPEELKQNLIALCPTEAQRKRYLEKVCNHLGERLQRALRHGDTA
jgi:class 3 adenylate cyclase